MGESNKATLMTGENNFLKLSTRWERPLLTYVHSVLECTHLETRLFSGTRSSWPHHNLSKAPFEPGNPLPSEGQQQEVQLGPGMVYEDIALAVVFSGKGVVLGMIKVGKKRLFLNVSLIPSYPVVS